MHAVFTLTIYTLIEILPILKGKTMKLEKMKPSKFTKQEKSWMLYDVANSAFVLVMVTTIMPIFFKDIASAGVDNAISTANWGFANSTASLILALLAPVLGTFADMQGYKKKFFSFFFFTGLIFTLLLTFISEGDWMWCIVLFVIARVGWSGANLFYDAFLVDVAEHKRMDRVSTFGYGWGYIGSVIPFIIVMALIFLGREPGQDNIPELHAKIGFVVVAVWWMLFTLPMLKNVTQHYYVEKEIDPVKAGFRRLWKTFREIRQYKQAFLFLLAYFFYIDGVSTIISMATAYGRDVGLGVTMLILAILMIQVVAFPFALLFGRLADRYSTRVMLYVGISVYTLITLITFFLPVLPTHSMKVVTFWVLAFLVATSQGGIQALSRSYFGKLIPREKSSEFFGFYNVFGKFAAIMGPALMGLIGALTGHSRWGILSIVVLFIIGGILLASVKPVEEAIPEA